MDFTKLRAAALKDGDDEEAVTVNTRALIDKVLARYSGEWTTLRELLQNAADAQASTVAIKFESLPSQQIPLSNTIDQSEILKHVLLHHTLRRLVVTNDGLAFGVKDWSRLKRIAEGNPDETKIGAFGVGFYSVFADCEEPFVSSGNEAMAFYWKGNSLFTRKLQLPPEQGNPNTSFVLDYRNATTPMPNLLSICQFLAISLTFVALQNIELWVDDWKIISLKKKVAPSFSIPIARDVETRTKEGLMNVQGLERESVQMDATFMNVVGWKPSVTASVSKPGTYDANYGNSSSDVPSLRSFFSRLTASSSHSQLKTKAMREEKALQDIVLEDLTAQTTANVFLRVTTAHIKTSVSSSFAAELERATKKPPPKTTKIAILTSSYDEVAASTKDNPIARGVDVFSSVLPSKKPGGRIFIGFPTHQTTGAGIHLSAPSVIPTVERESIDLNARWVVTWNREMLRVAGITARLAFSSEMADLSAKVKRAAVAAGRTKVTKDEIERFMPEALHTLNTFTFKDSTPSSQVSQLIEEGFWMAYKKASIEIYSTRGVLPTTTVRLATEDLSGFVEGIPVVPKALVGGDFVSKLRDFGLITEITIGDVKQELGAKALTKDQLVQFIGWAGRKAASGDIDRATVQSLLDVAVAMTGDVDGQGDVIALGSITNYLNVTKISAEAPIPPTTIPFKFTKASSIRELQCLGWDPLEIVPWLRYLIESNANRPAEKSLTASTQFAAQVLQVLSKGWEELVPQSKDTVISLLAPIPIIPTKLGMKKPGEAFFANVRLFDDLPTVTSCPGVKEKFLAAIGVRKTVDLETIFSRLLPPAGDPKQPQLATGNRHMELIKYLASVKDDIPASDMKRLKASRICPAEAGPKGLESTRGTSILYRISDLFEPKDSLRELGLPIIQWLGPPGSYKPGGTEGRFLTLLGIRAYPSAAELIELMASGDNRLRNIAMTYFIANHHINGYASFEIGAVARQFLPLQGDEERLVSPAECFTNERCAVLGFSILKRELHVHAHKFGVAMDPPLTECVNRLISKPAQNKRDASTLFSYFSGRLGEMGQNNVAKLADARIVPVIHQSTLNEYPNEKRAEQGDVRYLTPRHCYIGSPSTYGEIFDFVDFGTEANAFLLRCGSKHEPTKFELAAVACKEPARLLGIMQSPEKYLSLLKTLADDLPMLKRDKALFKQMKQSRFLLGYTEIPATKENRKSLKPEQSGPMDSEFGPDEDDAEDSPIKQWTLGTANDLLIIDDYISYRLFKGSLLCAPMDDKLEDFYVALGASTLGSIVQEDLRLGPPSEKQESAVKLRSHVLERSKLFLHEYDRNSIKHDSRWLDKSLNVQVVGSISLRRSLRGHNLSHTEKRSAACTKDNRSDWTLYIISGNNDVYQISQAICKLLLDRPNQQAYLTFETFLKLNLYELRSRGYNVERILRAKAAEQRIAEEERRKQLEAEQRQIRDQEEQWRRESRSIHEAAGDDRHESEASMPGAFGSESPENSPALPPKTKPRGLFSGLSRRLGLDGSGNGEAQKQLQNFLGGGAPHESQVDNPPSYDEANKGPTKPGSSEKVSSPAAVQQNLLNAIKSSRPHDSSTLFSPPTTQVIKEEASYCDSTPAQNIIFLAETSNGMRIFVSKTLSIPQSEFLGSNISSLNGFATVLHELADVYSLPRKALHIFFDEAGSTIAFNSSGSIFCNFRFFAQLHSKKMQSPNPREMADGRLEAACYWWVVIAHELAHNLVKEHSAEHSFYTEMLVASYFPKMMAKSAALIQAAPAPRQEASLLD
ncbi:ATPase of HSP90 chaperone topoisomerase II kinase [Venustampulla echinocandica]|uniref:ATPase of HSP90 chaperone topoisomerase II kinase n=1 Tax=Venustampulla echinocandica TaxID=2656787 RepID=A0A370TIT0_9HELO|nr:ATPase of HSP90 chaperone topoisomerase II kinase [Venustampulla echinocandica]RDL35265.1 ATPase of HSP90 chaperone topoisomerase II kinase [Venustampulla echinocandica]